MNVLTLSIKREPFDRILSGEKKQEFRKLQPKSAYKHVYFVDTKDGKEYKREDDVPEGDSELLIKPVRYDALKLCTGEYKSKRPYIIVEVLNSEIEFFVDENGNDIIREQDGEEFLESQIVYTLGEIIEKNV